MNKKLASVPADTPVMSFVPSQEAWATIEIAGAPEKARPIPRWLSGKFTEHLGTNVYGGAWAQLLFNPVFAPLELFSEPHGARDELRRTKEVPASLGFNTDEKSFIHPGVAYGWLPFGTRGSYRLVEGPDAEQHPAQTIAVPGDSPRVGLMTPFYVPKRRVSDFTLRLRVAAPEGTPRLSVGLFRKTARGFDVGPPISNIASVRPAPRASVHEIALRLNRPDVPRNRLALLAVSAPGPCVVALERAELTPDDAIDGWDPRVVNLWKKAHVTLLRFPGGNFVSGYAWKDGIGPRGQRPVRKNPAWFGCEFNLVGTDEWLRFCELINAAPLICVNAGNGTPEEAADWVEYCNGAPDTPMGRLRAQNGRREPYKVPVWEIGNELYGKWQIGAASAEEYGPRYDAFRRAMIARDPSIRILANGHKPEWDRVVAASSAEPLQTLTTHPLIGNMGNLPVTPEEAFQTIAAYPVWFERLQAPEIRSILAPRSRDPHLAITELQIMGARDGFPRNRSLSEAIYYAGMMNVAIRSRGFIDIVTHSALINHGGGMGKERGVVYTDPLYEAFRFYSELAGRRPVALRLSCAEAVARGVGGLPDVERVPQIDAVAALGPGGRRIHLIIVNRSVSEPARIEIRLGLWASDVKEAEIRLLASGHFADRNTDSAPRHVAVKKTSAAIENGLLRLEIPKHSLAAVRV